MPCSEPKGEGDGGEREGGGREGGGGVGGAGAPRRVEELEEDRAPPGGALQGGEGLGPSPVGWGKGGVGLGGAAALARRFSKSLPPRRPWCASHRRPRQLGHLLSSRAWWPPSPSPRWWQ